MKQSVLQNIQPVFRRVFEDNALVLKPETSAVDVPAWDSLNHIALIVELESFTGLSFTTDELVNLKNVGDFVELMISKGYHGNQ